MRVFLDAWRSEFHSPHRPSTFTNWTKTSAYSSLDPTACTLPDISLTAQPGRNLRGHASGKAARCWCSIISKGNSARCPSRSGSSRIRVRSRIFRPSQSFTYRPRSTQAASSISNTASTSQANSSVLVTVGGKQEHVARFPISVGESGVVSHFMHYIMVIVPLAAIAGGAAIFFFLRGRRKASVSAVS